MRTWRITAAVAAIALAAAACGGGDDDTAADDTTTEEAATDDGAEDDAADDGAEEEDMAEGGDVSGEVVVAGSSTVLPVAEYVLEVYRGERPEVDASYTSIGSGGGFERLCDLVDVDVSGASRAIDEDEAALCEENGVEFLELQFGVDALTMVTSTETDYVECLSTEQIVQIFGPEGATTWDEVVDGAPSEAIDIYAPDTDSGTYGFMVEDIMGEEESRQDYSASANDDVIVQGIQSGAGTWGFFGLAYYSANEDGLTAIAHENPDSGECVLPSIESAEAGEYGLVRPLFIYVNVESLTSKPQVADFVNFFLETAPEGNDFVGYVNTPGALEESVGEVASAM